MNGDRGEAGWAVVVDSGEPRTRSCAMGNGGSMEARGTEGNGVAKEWNGMKGKVRADD